MKLAKNFIAFCNELNIFNKTGARVLDSNYHITLKLLKKIAFLV